jgi:hypothetical protein
MSDSSLVQLVRHIEQALTRWLDEHQSPAPAPSPPSTAPGPDPKPSPQPGQPSAGGDGPRFLIVNHASVITDAELEPVAAACQRQAREDFAPAWHGLGAGTTVAVWGKTDTPVPADTVTIAVVDSGKEQGALGFHTETTGDAPLIVIYAKVAKDAGMPVSGVVAHEVLEELADEACSYWAYDNQGTMWALEVADPCQAPADGYDINGIPVSDWVTPAWFDPDSPGPYDHTGKIAHPFEVRPGGYAVVIKGGQVTQVYGDTAPPEMATRGWARKQRATEVAR